MARFALVVVPQCPPPRQGRPLGINRFGRLAKVLVAGRLAFDSKDAADDAAADPRSALRGASLRLDGVRETIRNVVRPSGGGNPGRPKKDVRTAVAEEKSEKCPSVPVFPVKNPGQPPDYCMMNGKRDVNSKCKNCIGWVGSVLQECYNEAYSNRK